MHPSEGYKYGTRSVEENGRKFITLSQQLLQMHGHKVATFLICQCGTESSRHEMGIDTALIRLCSSLFTLASPPEREKGENHSIIRHSIIIYILVNSTVPSRIVSRILVGLRQTVKKKIVTCQSNGK